MERIENENRANNWRETYTVNAQGRKDGTHTIWNITTGNKITETEYKNGIKHGFHKEWSWFGKLARVEEWQNGERVK